MVNENPPGDGRESPGDASPPDQEATFRRREARTETARRVGRRSCSERPALVGEAVAHGEPAHHRRDRLDGLEDQLPSMPSWIVQKGSPADPVSGQAAAFTFQVAVTSGSSWAGEDARPVVARPGSRRQVLRLRSWGPASR